MEVLEVIPSKTLKKSRAIPAGESRAVSFSAAAARVAERPPFDDEAREAELEHVAVLGYN
ncbi:hypothetical protein [Rubrivivax gelatinosus]|uniref:Uncharacterized protein n=2 Tax=Rubrivivax gelatinosus TaxID=28068 RepID=A0A4R2M050_RUBGE|nr:hypothetical protein [Rubrivivax gelatinosus]MBK1687976.1 hypothetical protein [Rubrivivax gelatinosus]TCO99259.1 hypothetical protein EV684_11552 [Rubrivivax gelatinosus]